MTRTIDTLTIGQFRALMRYGGSDSDTVAQALDSITGADRAQAEWETTYAAYQAYVAQREQRRADAIASAAIEANRKTKGGDGERLAARQAARLEALTEFDAREPLLDFQPWVDAGQPALHTRTGVLQRAANVVQEVLAA